MTPPDQSDDRPSALSRLERALAGFGEPRSDPAADPAAERPNSDVDSDTDSDSDSGFDSGRSTWEPPSAGASPVLDIASAVEAVERLSAVQDSEEHDAGEQSETEFDAPLSDADEYVLAATAAGTDEPDAEDGSDYEPELGDAVEDDDDAEHVFRYADLRARVKEVAEEGADEDERSRLEPAESQTAVEYLPPPRVTDAAASWSRDLGDTQLPYFLVEEDVPVAAEPVPTLEELRQPRPALVKEQRQASIARALLEIPILLFVAALIAFLVKSFLAQAYYIPSGSMLPQLRIDDRVVVSKLSYKLHDPRRGDIVVFDDPRRDEANDDDEPNFLRKIGEGIGIVQPSTDEFIKRVVGLPGDTVEGHDGHVYINGHLLVEPYLKNDVVTSDFPKETVKSGRLWVMGDNRTGSADSRFFGQIDTDTIVGRALVTVWPFGHVEFL
ncbi:MAG TPA: signal peptidase I [Acidimicrobiales bacterium]|nr:signal peptidase I [Acidimicrobiales bacterium]